MIDPVAVANVTWMMMRHVCAENVTSLQQDASRHILLLAKVLAQLRMQEAKASLMVQLLSVLQSILFLAALYRLVGPLPVLRACVILAYTA